MNIVLQKVSEAEVSVDGETVGSIGTGYLVLVGVVRGDTEDAVRWMADKILNLRLFPGEGGKINDRTLRDAGGSVLVVSQFTLAGDVSKGNRPDYTASADREDAAVLYHSLIRQLKEAGIARVESGRFGAMMRVRLTNEGPVTLLLNR